MPHVLTARINGKFGPIDRGEFFEDPLNEALTKAGAGAVVGGGTQLASSREIAYCELEIESTLPLAEAAPAIIATLNGLGAPKGSVLFDSDANDGIRFGETECFGLYLNGTSLPAEVYEQSDVNYLIEEISRLLGDAGSIRSYWEGPTETALYLFGPSFAEMGARIQELLDSYPLCRESRIVQLA